MNPPQLNLPERLETERLLLLVHKAGEGRELDRAVRASYRQLRPWIPWAKKPPTVRGAEKRCRLNAAAWIAREHFTMIIRLKSDGTLVGEAGLHHCDWTVPKFEVGYWIHTRHAGKGYATETVRAIVQLARRHLKPRRLELRTDARNLRSARVATKAGFTLEATLRNFSRDNRGRLADTLLFAQTF